MSHRASDEWVEKRLGLIGILPLFAQGLKQGLGEGLQDLRNLLVVTREEGMHHTGLNSLIPH